jgi:hypothetical protein
MKMLDRLRQRTPRGAATTADPPGDAGPKHDGTLPIEGYDKLDQKAVTDRLRSLSQAEMEAVESYERAHGARPYVLDKLRYMRTTEPLPDYDTLTPEQITEVLAGADAETVKAIRDYERKFADRKVVLDETARVLPTSKPSAGEAAITEEKDARVRSGIAGREKATADPGNDAEGPGGS